MIVNHFLHIWIILSFIRHISSLSYNQPKLCPNATWNASAITFASSALVGVNPSIMFVDTDNTVYTVNTQNNWIGVWPDGSNLPARNISGGLNSPYGLFVSETGDIYIDNGQTNDRVDKWSSNSTNSTPAMFVCASCLDLFIDVNNHLYCTVQSEHKVLSKSLNNRLNVWNIVAGTGTAGSTSTTLNYPTQTLVDINLHLYVADYSNNRIQKFSFGQLNGTTINISPFTLNGPTRIAFDADGYLFISDRWNSRILGSDRNGFRCIASCNGGGPSSTQLSLQFDIRFDSYGNLYVVDWANSRIQKFLLLQNSCTATTTAINMATSVANSQLITSSSVSNINVISYNQPTFSPLAMWNGNGITFVTVTAIGAALNGMFVDIYNTIYVANFANSIVQVWSAGNNLLTRNITTGVSNPYSVFVTSNGDIYIDNGLSNNRVDKWTSNATGNSTVMSVTGACYGLFIDINNNLYCSMYAKNQVATKSLNSNSTLWTVAAGTDCSGSTSNTLYQPRGIFVDTSLNLYVADCGNDRVQKFLSTQTVAITVAGSNSTTGTITLNCPSDVKLDGNGYLFIADYFNNRIVASGPNGFRCIIGCSSIAGSTSSQLYYPTMLSFDSYGNIFVVDSENNRIQKFTLISNTTYSISVNQPNFCPSTTWYIDAVTIDNSSMVGTNPNGIFVSLNNTLYAVSTQFGRLAMWLQGSSYLYKNISGNLGVSYGVFATVSGDIYVDNSATDYRVDKWTMNSNGSVPVMSITAPCYSFFLDISNTLYCAMPFSQIVVKKWLLNNDTTTTVAAGTGYCGALANQLCNPSGIFVDLSFNLYVGDCSNNRVQLFPLGQMSATTIVGSTVPGTITLNCPNAVTLDANGYLFISDTYNSRIVGSGPNGFRCILGCSGVGSSSSQLYYPRQFSFDTYGNLFVADQMNNRIQKFILASNSCSLSYNQPKLCTYSTWYANASTIATTAQIGLLPYGLFIDGVNTVYMPSRASNYTLVLTQGSMTMKYINGQSVSPFSVFVTMNADMYIDNGYINGRVNRFVPNITTPVMNVNGSCYGLFVDLNNYLYCSMKNLHQVVKLLLNNGTTIPTIAAGTGLPGSTSTMLNSQQGIYVDNSINLYVADCRNNRVQVFQSRQFNGTTMVGNGSSGTITLNYPTDLVLDNNGYLFIVDSNNHRIVGSSWNGYRCVAGCSGSGGSFAYQLSFPQSLAFDSYGNLYVTDRNNSRVQKFTLTNYNCNETIPNLSISTQNTSSTTDQTSIAQTTSKMVESSTQLFSTATITAATTVTSSTTTPTTITATTSTSTSTSTTTSTATTTTSTSTTTTSTSTTTTTATTTTSTSTTTSTATTSTSTSTTTTTATTTTSTSTSTTTATTSTSTSTTTTTATTSTSTTTTTATTSTSTSTTTTTATTTTSTSTTTSTATTSTSTTTTTATTTTSTSTTTSTASTSTSTTTTTATTSTSTTTTTTTATTSTSTSTTTTTATTSTSTTTTTTTTSTSTTTATTTATTSTTTTTATTSTSTSTTTATTSSTTTTTTTTMTTNIATTTTVTTITTTTTSIIYAQTPYTCPGNVIGSPCNIISDPCIMYQPCFNSGTCYRNNTLPLGYKCNCQTGYTGQNCQNDQRVCTENTCWNNGTCVEVNTTTFKCECEKDYTGVHCELVVDFCANISCANGGLCRTIDLEWKCICLDLSLYYGDYCQFQTNALTVKKAVAKSFAGVAITSVVCTCSFILIMDLLKYVFHIDPVRIEREQLQLRKQQKETKKVGRSDVPKKIVRPHYIP